MKWLNGWKKFAGRQGPGWVEDEKGKKKQGVSEIESSRLGEWVGKSIGGVSCFWMIFQFENTFYSSLVSFLPIRLARLTRCDVTSIIQCRSAFKAFERGKISVCSTFPMNFSPIEREKPAATFFQIWIHAVTTTWELGKWRDLLCKVKREKRMTKRHKKSF